MNIEVQGSVAPGFESVQDTFRENWDGIEVGASLSVVHQGKTIIDLWAGWQNRERSIPWKRDTLVNVYSTTKGMASLAIAVLYDEGRIDYDAPVVEYWPEFGAAGKDKITVAQLLSHQAGLCGVDTRLTVEDLYNWDKMTQLLAAQQPLWPPGQGAGYHAVTWGYLPGELIRRITGERLGHYFHRKVAAPLAADFFISLPEHEHHRVADMIGPNHARIQPKPNPNTAATNPPPLFAISLQNPSIRPYKDASSPAWRSAEIAAANGQANARGIATIYGALAQGGIQDDVRIIRPSALNASTIEEVSDTTDLVLGHVMRRGRGFILNTDGGYGPGAMSFGHSGAGGSTGFADPSAALGFGYAMNQMEADASTEPRSRRLINAVYDALKVQGH